MAILGVIFDIVLIGLLAATVFFVLRLHNRLEIIRGGKDDLESLLKQLVSNTSSAERNLAAMRATAQDLNETLGKQVRGAQNASEELSYLLASADNKARQLMTAVETTRVPVAPVSVAEERPAPLANSNQPAAATPAPAPAPTDRRQMAEQELLKAIEKLR